MTAFLIDVSQIEPLCRRYRVASMSLFGSVARGDATAQSDIDLLVSFADDVGLLHQLALERELSAVLGRKVDLLTEGALSPYLRYRVLKERQLIYAA